MGRLCTNRGIREEDDNVNSGTGDGNIIETG